ncbi:AAA family ATPase [Candidatus Saccharibacteria bacterium]|nr:AAA family ATPase [Candidatus Saccharibacteria bacterium]
MQRLLQTARIYACAYDPEHPKIRAEFMIAAIADVSTGVCARLTAYVDDEMPEFWMKLRVYMAGYYNKDSYNEIVRRIQETTFGSKLSHVKPDRLMQQLIKASDRSWQNHRKVVKSPTPVDYLLAEILMYSGDMDILDMTLLDFDVERNELVPYLMGSSRHITNEYMDTGLQTRAFDSFEGYSEWRTNSAKGAKKKTKVEVQPKLADSIADVERLMHERVIGQRKAIDSVIRALKIERSGLKDPKQPVAVLLFAGPTGVGKTEITRALAEITKRPMRRLDMSEYQESHSVMRLFGAPPSYVGYDDGGQLTKFISDNPNGIVVFDEAEKAHPDVLNAVLQIAEEGTLTDGRGKIVSFADAIVFITTNIGAVEAARQEIGFSAGETSREHAFKKALEKFFKPEFRGRLTGTVIFEPLTAGDALKIAELEQEKVARLLLENRNIELRFRPLVQEYIVQQSKILQYGARDIKTTVRTLISAALSDFIVENDLPDGSIVIIGVDDDKTITFNTPPPY